MSLWNKANETLFEKLNNEYNKKYNIKMSLNYLGWNDIEIIKWNFMKKKYNKNVIQIEQLEFD